MLFLSKRPVPKLLITAFLLFMTFGIKAQQHTISGYVTDAKSSETLLGASVYDPSTMKGAVTNNFGYYTLHLPSGPVTIKSSYVGYSPFETSFVLRNDTVINIRLNTSTELEEVTITGRAIESQVTGTQMSTIDIPIRQIQKIPAIFGESDVIKSLQLLPGVQSGTEGSAGLYVRGGGPDENLILLDGVPLYNVNHAMGFFSAFNADAIKNVTLYKGNFPARFGGRLSSIVDVHTKDGDMSHFHGNVSVGLISAKLNVEGPIIKDKTSFNLSFRRTYYDLFTAPVINKVLKNIEDSGLDKALTGYYFYDLNLKINHKFSDRDRLFLSIYSGDDKVYVKVKQKEEDVTYSSWNLASRNPSSYQFNAQTKLGADWHWGNRIAALRWNHVVNPRLFMNVTGAYTQYRHLMDVTYDYNQTTSIAGTEISSMQEAFSLGMNSGIYDGTAKVDFDYKPVDNHNLKFGVDATRHLYNPSSTGLHLKTVDDGQIEDQFDSIVSGDKIRAWETDAYVEDDWEIGARMRLNMGLHYSTFSVNSKTYHSVQPRVSLRALATENLSFKAGYAAMTQYVHLLSSNSISLPTDLWVPVTQRILPMDAHQFAIGAFYEWKGFEFSLEGYYKYMNNVVEYKDGASFFSLDATDWQDKVCMGQGYSYGAEFFVQRTVGKLTGWVGYTYAHANRLFNREGQELNFGKPFPAKYDRRHDLNIVLSYEFNEAFDLSATWVYSSGNCATLAMQDYHGIYEFGYFPDLSYVEYRNNYRFNSYQRLDLGLNWHKQKKHGVRTWSLNIYNTLCHNNPFIVYPESTTTWVNDPHNPMGGYLITENYLEQVCIFPIMPSLSYSFKF